MKKLLIISLIFTLAVFAGVFVFRDAKAKVLPWNVHFTLRFDDVVCEYDLAKEMQPYVKNCDSRAFFRGAKGKTERVQGLLETGLPFEAVAEYILPGFSALTEKFRFVNCAAKDAQVSFGKKGFTYVEGSDGREADFRALFFAAIKGCGTKQSYLLPTKTIKAVTVRQLKERTTLKGSFTTSFPNSSANRIHNVALAADSINGVTVRAGETFSFNGTVGRRTEERGYKNAKVISDGVYADGVGGGVCQVSTTLYNALLLSEVLPKACRHSLVPSYVMAGFDAMVSDGGADLTFTAENTLYIQATTDVVGKTLTVKVFGVPNRYKVVRKNTEQRQPFAIREIVDGEKYPQLVYTDQTLVVRGGSDGVTSRSYLCYYDGDALAFTRQIRSDNYKKVDKIVARGAIPRPSQPSADDSDSSICA